MCHERGSSGPARLRRAVRVEGIYAALLDSRTCLIDLGYDIPDAPGFEAYDADDAYWTPFADVPHRELSKAEETCPQPFF